MTDPLAAAGPPSHAGPDDASHARLRQAAHDLEGVFVGELFKAMRATVPQDGFLGPAPGQELFTAIFDDQLARLYGSRARAGTGEALYHQLARRLDEGPGVRRP